MSSTESWVYLKAGKLMLHVENDGHRFLRHGPEAFEQEVTLEELGRGTTLYEEAKKLLQNKSED